MKDVSAFQSYFLDNHLLNLKWIFRVLALVDRPKQIVVKYTNLKGKQQKLQFNHMEARVNKPLF